MTVFRVGKNPSVPRAHLPLVKSDPILLRSNSIPALGKMGKNPPKNENSDFSSKLAMRGDLCRS